MSQTPGPGITGPPPQPLGRRLAGFTVLPAIAAVSPLLVLPAVARVAGPDGWSSAIAGEAIGTFAAIAVAYGWTTIGPALVATAKDDVARGRLYREALVVRLATALVVLPLTSALIWLVATPGFELLAVLMGLQGALIAMSFTWFAVGLGRPGAIAFYDAIPRLVAAMIAALAIIVFGTLEIYPLSGIAVTVVGTGLYTWRVLRRYPATWPRWRDASRLARSGAPVALNDAALGTYSAVPTPLVTVIYPGVPAAGFASADKLLKLGQFLPLTLANALQSWTAEVSGPERGRRLRSAIAAHAGLGVLGWVVFATLGPFVSALLFGPAAAATADVVITLGFAFALYSVRTSMTRHLLFPEGAARTVMNATLVGTAVGIPTMIALALLWGPAGAAVGYAITELTATALILPRSRAALRSIEQRPRDR